MIETITMFRTTDGLTFDVLQDAQAHELRHEMVANMQILNCKGTSSAELVDWILSHYDVSLKEV